MIEKSNLLTVDQCNELISIAEAGNTWKVYSTSKMSYKVTGLDLLPSFFVEIINEYSRKKLKVTLSNISFSVLKYEPADFFSKHIDRDSSKEFNKDFLYNLNIKLNSDFEGGEFLLEDNIFNAGVGDLYHYKSTQYHEVLPITKGIRYTGLVYIRERDVVTTIRHLL